MKVVNQVNRTNDYSMFRALVKPIEDTIECEECNGAGEVMIAKLYPTGHTEVIEECPVCAGEGLIYKPK